MPGMPNLLTIQAGARGTVRAGAAPARPATASEAAYGPAVSRSGMAGSPLAPNDAGGIAFLVGVAGVAALVLIYYSLPG